MFSTVVHFWGSSQNFYSICVINFFFGFWNTQGIYVLTYTLSLPLQITHRWYWSKLKYFKTRCERIMGVFYLLVFKIRLCCGMLLKGHKKNSLQRDIPKKMRFGITQVFMKGLLLNILIHFAAVELGKINKFLSISISELFQELKYQKNTSCFKTNAFRKSCFLKNFHKVTHFLANKSNYWLGIWVISAVLYNVKQRQQSKKEVPSREIRNCSWYTNIFLISLTGLPYVWRLSLFNIILFIYLKMGLWKLFKAFILF